eukprot:1477298-Pyramimonas_sp.AAC.1
MKDRRGLHPDDAQAALVLGAQDSPDVLHSAAPALVVALLGDARHLAVPGRAPRKPRGLSSAWPCPPS